jgi:pimeloyl-ACP methyl ester carboxylesterase
MQFAYQFSEYCQRLVLVDSGGLGRQVSLALRAATLPGAEFVLPVIANRRVRDAGVALSRLFGPLPFRLRPSAAEVARGYATLADSPARTAFVHSLRSVVEPGGQRVSASDRFYLGEGRPTLIVWGALDTVIPVAHAYAAHAGIPGSVLEIFEQARHFPHTDEPARFAKVVLHFLDSTEPSPIDRALLRDRMIKHSRLIRELQAPARSPEPEVGSPTADPPPQPSTRAAAEDR